MILRIAPALFSIINTQLCVCANRRFVLESTLAISCLGCTFISWNHILLLFYTPFLRASIKLLKVILILAEREVFKGLGLSDVVEENFLEQVAVVALSQKPY